MVKHKKMPSQRNRNNKKRPSRLRRFFFASRKLNRTRFAIFVLLFAAIGGTLIYFAQADSFNANDEQIHYTGINNARLAAGQPALPVAGCLNTLARIWSKTMATTKNPDKSIGRLYHNDPGFYDQDRFACRQGYLPWAGENIAEASCNVRTTCAQDTINSLIKSPEHYANIVDGRFNYMGVGAYRDSNNFLWITQEFIQCASCLVGIVTVSSSTTPRSTPRSPNITAHPGQRVVFYHNVTNIGLEAINYPLHVTTYHYAASGSLIASYQVNITRTTTAKGGVYSWANSGNISTAAKAGEKYCHAIWYNYAFGPFTDPAISPQTCITVN